MIIYEYKCKSCSKEFEVEQHLTDDKYKEYHCPKCNKVESVERIIKNRTFILSDSQGWSKTGYDKNVDTVGSML